MAPDPWELEQIEREERESRERLEEAREANRLSEGQAQKPEHELVHRLEEEWKHALERLRGARGEGSDSPPE